MSEPTPKAAPESQKQRWIKYGSNVVLTVIVVIVLAIVATYAAQRHNRRIDTTLARTYSLKPQTLQIIRDLKQPIKLVSLYRREKGGRSDIRTPDYYQIVRDLLEEYQRNGSRIEIDAIDPDAEPSKVDQLVEQVKSNYGGEIKAYADYLKQFPTTLERINAFSTAEIDQLLKLNNLQVEDRAVLRTVNLVVSTVQSFPDLLKRIKDRIDRENKEPIPDYKGLTSAIQTSLNVLSENLKLVGGSFTASKEDAKVPDALRTYMAEALPRFEAMQKIADEEVARIDKLGELKIDDLRTSLRRPNSVLVMGENDLRVLSFDDLWREARDIPPTASAEKPVRQFAGEQQISTAIFALSHKKKPKVVFVRAGGAPFTEANPFSRQAGALSEIGDTLRALNFDVVEKDLSGQYAMQAQMQGMPASPEPTDEEMKDAVWVVLSLTPAMTQQGPSPMAPKLTEHLQNGGSAIVLFSFGTDSLDTALNEYGIRIKTNEVICHALIDSAARSGDNIEDAQRMPFIFSTRQFGDEPMVRPVNSLNALLVPVLPVSATGIARPIIPIPNDPRTWAESSFDASEPGKAVAFDEGKDTPGPLFGGAVAETGKGGRLVVIGGLEFITNGIVSIPDEEILYSQRRLVPRFPANAELMINAAYWTSKLDTMLAISPSAMQVSRIAAMRPAQEAFWRNGVLVVILPALVVVLGIVTYIRRRD